MTIAERYADAEHRRVALLTDIVAERDCEITYLTNRLQRFGYEEW